jgi:multiple sugar transport system substrate-binding protein
MRVRSAAIATVVLAVGASSLVACSSSGSGGSGGGGKGPITVVTGKDNSNVWPHLIQEWNQQHPDEKATLKQQSAEADQQLSDLQQHFQSKDSGYDVVTVDVIWTAEFAAKGWLVPLTGDNAIDTKPLLPATVKAATYNNTLYAAPYASDGGLLYYRKDIVSKPPTTWDELIADCKGKTANTITGSQPGCYAGQFAKYEGLTVNAAEAINAAGGVIVKSDGKTPDVDTPKAAAGLNFLVNGFKQGYIPKEAISFEETESLNAFSAGKLVFMRNWPYADAILNAKPSKVIGKFGIAPLPGPNGHGASSLGGHSLAVSSYSKHQASAAAFVKWMEEPAQQKWDLTQGTLAPVTTSLYSDPTLTKKFPYLPTLLKSIQTAVPRPVTPFYPDVTEAIETNVYAALQGDKTTQQALSDIQKAIQSAAS